MQRNSSFFWHADSQVWEDEDEQDFGEEPYGIGLTLDDEHAEIEDQLVPKRGHERHEKEEHTVTDQCPLLSSEKDYGTSKPQADHPSQHHHVSFAPVETPRHVEYEQPVRDHHSSLQPTITDKAQQHSIIRFQVVVWYIGALDVVLGHVPMKFRVTIFWNDTATDDPNTVSPSSNGRSPPAWTMQGRMQAVEEESSHDRSRPATVDVPPVSILNAVNFETIGSPEVTMMKEETRLFRWTAMYNAVLFQGGENLRVDQFPHDKHDLVLKLGILAHRRPGGRWDKKRWILGLATEKDSQGSTRIPHGLLVDHVSIPGFNHSADGLQFDFVPLPMGSGEKQRTKDKCLQVKLRIVRESRHYDKNIVPLLAVLNVVAISCLPRNFDSATASTETMLSIAFVQVGIRLTIDSRLPDVGYQIKIQKFLNECFWLLCCLVLETNLVFFLVMKRGWSEEETDWFDLIAASTALLYTCKMLVFYYFDHWFSLSDEEALPVSTAVKQTKFRQLHSLSP